MNEVVRPSNPLAQRLRDLYASHPIVMEAAQALDTLTEVINDAERFRWLQEAVDRNDRFSVYEHGTKVFELRTAIDIVRGMTAARDGKGAAVPASAAPHALKV